MARAPVKVRYLHFIDGRYSARKGVPIGLRQIVGTTELLERLGADRKDAIFRLPAAIARFNVILADAKRGLPPAPPLLSIPHVVHDHYRAELRHDDLSRYGKVDPNGEFDPPAPRSPEIKDRFERAYLHNLRKIAGGFIDDEDTGLVEATIGWAIDEATTVQGKPRPERGSKLWIDLARALASAQIESIDRSRERDQGDFKGKPTFELLTVPPPTPMLETAPVSINGLFERYIARLARSGGGDEARKRWRSVFNSLTAHLGHDDALKITKADVRAWIETLRSSLADKTIKDTYLGAVKAILNDAFDHEMIPSNPTQGIKLKVSKADQGREKGFTDDEARAIIRASRSYQPKHSDNPQTRESEALTAAKRWTPLLCAHTGARISEMTQLRKEDVRTIDGIHHIRITPDAGSVKTRQFRDVPLHRQIIDAGFLDFVAGSPDGPLFFRTSAQRTGTTHPSKTVSGRLSQWLQSLGLIPEGIQPNHAWRHRLKTIANDLEITARTIDAIQGHAARTAGEGYGDVPMKTKAAAISKLPDIDTERLR